MEPPGCFRHALFLHHLGDRSGERDDVVAHFTLDFEDPVHSEIRMFTEGACGFGRNLATLT